MAHEEQGSQPQPGMWRSSEAEHWQKDLARRQQDFSDPTRRMLEAAGLKPGDHVLDVAAGTGDQSIMAASSVGPGGSVLATDVSADMLAIATGVFQHAGLTNITTRVMDAQQLDLADNTFDAVICRLGLMLVPNRQQAFSEIHRVLKPDGKLAALVWSSPAHNPLWSLPLGILSKYAGGAPSGGPNPFSLSDPSVFGRELTESGFHTVSAQAVPFESHYTSSEAFLNSTGSRLIAGVVGQLPPQEQERLLDEIRQALSQFEGQQGLVAPAEFLLGVGSK
jgi:ubiquinone/menaquinone biosynthesis C-methylase UbiE